MQLKKCQQCQLHQKAPAEAPLHPWEWPGQPWSRVHIDYAGPYKGHMYLVVIDAHCKWMDVHIMQSTTSAATIVKLREIFATHGLLETIVSDNGPNFTSAEFENFLSKNGIKHTKYRHTIQLQMDRRSEQLEPSKKGERRWKREPCKTSCHVFCSSTEQHHTRQQGLHQRSC